MLYVVLMVLGLRAFVGSVVLVAQVLLAPGAVLCEGDSAAYSIRTRTKKQAVAQLEALPKDSSYGLTRSDYGELIKVTVDYTNGFDLIRQCLSEGGVEY